jgi:hypothetical protein
MAAGNAIFTEVLQIGIDTSQFAAQMKQVEEIYANSIRNMPDLAAVGTTSMTSGMLKMAEVFTLAAEQIGKSASSITEDVAIMVQQSNANMEAMAAKTKAAASSTASSMSEGMGTFERFGTAIERAAFRVPAMLLVGTAMVAMLAAFKAPIDAVVAGFENIGNQTPAFKQVKTELADTFSVMESIAAKPIFDSILQAMQQLNDWLTRNKPLIDQIVLAFGNLLNAALRPLLTLLEQKPTGLLSTINTLVTAFGIGVSSVKLLINEITDLLKVYFLLDPSALATEGWKKWSTDVKAALKDVGKDFDTFGKEQLDIAAASMHATDAANGKTNDAIPDIKPASQLKTSSEIMADYRVELAGIKEDAKKATDDIADQVSKTQLSHQAALPKILAVNDAEKKSVDSLIAAYREKLKAATDLPQLDASKMRQLDDRLLLGGRGSGTSSPYSSIEASGKTARNAAAKEEAADEKLEDDAKLKVEDTYFAAKLALLKKSVAEGHETRAVAAQAEIEEEKRHHEAILSGLNTQYADPKSKEAVEQQAKILEENARNATAMAKAVTNLTDAQAQDAAITLKHVESMDKLRLSTLATDEALAKSLGNKREELALSKELIQLKIRLDQQNLATLGSQYTKEVSAHGQSPEAEKLRLQMAQLQAQLVNLGNELGAKQYSGSNLGKFERAEDTGHDESVGDKLKQDLHLDDAARDFQNANNSVEKFAAGLEGVAGIIDGLGKAVSGAVSAYQKGGALGAAGSLLQNKSVTDGIGSVVGKFSESMGKMIPMIGPLIGGMFSAISGMFSAGIQTMVNNINEQIKDINQQAQLKQIGIQQQIKELQAEEQSAISALGGKKKASAQLKSILDSLSAQIAQLQFQAAQTVQQFNDMATAGGLGNMTGIMASWASTWQQINQQVEQYIQAGGSVATAAEYLNQQLKQQRLALQDQLNSGNQTAIGDAIQLLDLETQKVNMMKQEAATEFGMLNADSMERRTSNAVKLGTELTKQRAQYALQLADTNNQISLDQQKVAAESKVFTIAQSLAALRLQSNALTITALNEQLAKYQDMATLIRATNGMNFTPGSINPGAGLNGTQAPIPGEPSIAGPVTVGTVTVNVGGSLDPTKAGEIGAAIGRGIRSGQTTYSSV